MGVGSAAWGRGRRWGVHVEKAGGVRSGRRRRRRRGIRGGVREAAAKRRIAAMVDLAKSQSSFATSPRSHMASSYTIGPKCLPWFGLAHKSLFHCCYIYIFVALHHMWNNLYISYPVNLIYLFLTKRICIYIRETRKDASSKLKK